MIRFEYTALPGSFALQMAALKPRYPTTLNGTAKIGLHEISLQKTKTKTQFSVAIRLRFIRIGFYQISWVAAFHHYGSSVMPGCWLPQAVWDRRAALCPCTQIEFVWPCWWEGAIAALLTAGSGTAELASLKTIIQTRVNLSPKVAHRYFIIWMTNLIYGALVCLEQPQSFLGGDE